MTANRLGLTDGVKAELNAPPTTAERLGMRFGRPRIPARPGDDADADTWITYVTALGAEAGAVAAWTVEQLKDLAGRLGG
jgi:hypothetical protein